MKIKRLIYYLKWLFDDKVRDIDNNRQREKDKGRVLIKIIGSKINVVLTDTAQVQNSIKYFHKN